MASRGKIPSNATKISLHERFSSLRSPTRGGSQGNTVQRVRQNAAALQAASTRNRRLAQQMEKRLASKNMALKLKKKSIKLRLGEAPTFSTGGLRGQGASRGVTRGIGRGKLRGSRGMAGRGKAVRGTTVRGRGAATVKHGTTTPKRVKKQGAPVLKSQPKAIQGNSRQQTVVKKMKIQRNLPPNFKAQVTTSKSVRGRGGKPLRGRGGRGAIARNTNNPPAVRGQKSVRGRAGQGSRGGRGRGAQKSALTREDLDKQLDQYMSGTKHSLDHELDSYMKVSGSGDVEMK